jgi:hypothetical protein
MKIHSPSFSGSITQDLDNALAELSGSFTGSFTGSFKGDIEVSEATFDVLTVRTRTNLSGSVFASASFEVNGNVNVINGGELQVEGVNVLDTAIAFAIALG